VCKLIKSLGLEICYPNAGEAVLLLRVVPHYAQIKPVSMSDTWMTIEGQASDRQRAHHFGQLQWRTFSPKVLSKALSLYDPQLACSPIRLIVK